jgi:tRNA A37 N6-isopentenylltransferase MiaA
MSSSSVPPRFVPTLTEVVQPCAVTVQTLPLNGAAELLAISADEQAQIVQRILQRVDLMLERRLREVVGQLILEQTQTLAVRLREEIEHVVSQSVNQAVEQEMGSTPTGS